MTMVNTASMNKPEWGENSEFSPVCATLHDASEILHMADRVPDETMKAPLIESASKMVRNVLDALEGRRTDGLIEPPVEDDD
jgi:hypothetical protein